MEDVAAAGRSLPKDSNDCVILSEGGHADDRERRHTPLNDHVRYGSIPKKIAESDPLNRQPLSELADYFHVQKESIYRRSRREPLGKSYSHGTQFPEHIAKDPNFAFGKQSESDHHFGPIPPDQAEDQWLRKTDPEGVEQEKDVQKKIDFRYDWVRAGIAPDRYRFGYKIVPNPEGHRQSVLGQHSEATRIISRRENDMQERNRRRHVGQGKPQPAYLKHMDPNHKFGISPKDSINWKAEQCLRYDGHLNEDDHVGKVLWKGSAPPQAEAMVHGIASPVQNQRNTARDCIWPVNLDNEFTEIRDLQQVLEIWNHSGLDSNSATYKAAVDQVTRSAQQQISLSGFMVIYNRMMSTTPQSDCGSEHH